MLKPLPLVNAKDYVSTDNGYAILHGSYLDLPGCVTHNPEEGAQQYNEALLARLNYKRDSHTKAQRVADLFKRYSTNHRVIKVMEALQGDASQVLSDFSHTEVFLLINNPISALSHTSSYRFY